MKILAIEKELPAADWSNESDTLLAEAKSVYELMLANVLREIYFTEDKNAVLILECENKKEAEQLLQALPLVQKKLIAFDLLELNPYTGFSRLFKE